MAQSVVNLFVKDNGFNAKLKNAMKMFAQLGGAANSAKGQFSKFADGIAQVAQSQQMLNAALKGNPYGLMAQAATMAFTKIIELSTQASEAEMRAAEDAQRKAEIQQTENEAIGRSTGELMAKYELLRVEWLNLSSDQQKNDWIKQNQSAFKSLNLAVDGVTSAENVFVNNTSQVVAALKARAEAEAYADLYKEQIKKNALNKATGQYNPTKSAKIGDRPSLREAKLAGITSEDYTWETRTVHDRYGRPGTIRESRGLNKTGVAKMNQLYAMGGASAENADRMQADYWASKMAQAQANANALSNNSLFGPVGSGGKGGKGGKIEVPVKPVYVPEEGTPDYIKAMISDLQSKLGKEKDAGAREGLLFDIKALQDEYKSMTTLDVAEGIEDPFVEALSPLQQLNAELAQLKQNLELSPNTEAYQANLQAIADKEKEIAQFKGFKNLAKDSKKVDESFKSAATAISSVGSAMQSIEDPTVKVIGMIAEAVASIALGFSQAIGQDVGEKGNVWYGIAAAAAGVASMVSTIAAIHSATGYAEGGMIKGNSYSGDNIGGLVDGSHLVGLNAGEIVLNQAQTSNVANALKGGGMGGNMHLTARLDGKDLLLSIDRTGQTLGYGQLVFFK